MWARDGLNGREFQQQMALQGRLSDFLRDGRDAIGVEADGTNGLVGVENLPESGQARGLAQQGQFGAVEAGPTSGRWSWISSSRVSAERSSARVG